MTSRQQRVLRGTLVGTVATLLAATSHTIAGGPAPALLLIALMAALATPVAAALVGPRPSLPRLAAAVAVSQVAFHTAFQLLGFPTGSGAAAAPAHVHAPLDPSLIAAGPIVPEGAGMYLAHAVAAILTVVLLWRGEVVVRAIAGATRAVLRRAEATRIPPRPVARVRAVPRAPRIRSVFLLSSLSRRGPPAAAGA